MSPYTPGHPGTRSVARGDPPEEDGVVRSSHWRGRLEEAIEEEEASSSSLLKKGHCLSVIRDDDVLDARQLHTTVNRIQRT